MTVRAGLEPQAALLAAARLTDGDFNRVAEQADVMEETDGQIDQRQTGHHFPSE